jgi:hypothetical protein
MTRLEPRPHWTTVYREISEHRLAEFLSQGYKQRHFFPHRFYFLPKCGPDGFKLAKRMCGVTNPDKSWQINLYAASPAIDEFPAELFFDSELMWHQQQFGKMGQIATADLVIKGNRLYGTNYISDAVQRIARRREFKTKIENRFKGWHRLLLNSIMSFALDKGLDSVCSPTAEFILRQIPPSRTVGRDLFQRIYDDTVHEHFRVTKQDAWWRIDVGENRDRVILPEKKTEIVPHHKTICLCHDIERGQGHMGLDSALASQADQEGPRYLRDMLAIEKQMNVKATYHILGSFFAEVREPIENDGHCIAFHSYDHQSDPFWPLSKVETEMSRLLRCSDLKPSYRDQLEKVRDVDYRIKGYRPPRSKITREISDRRLCFHNFEWLASSAHSLGATSPQMEHRLVKIPILFDDFPMYKNRVPYEIWEQQAIAHITENDFVAFSLHDCYAPRWLPHYQELLEKINGLGTLKTLNEVASEVIFRSAQ